MCHGGDISILVIFDMLECYILYMCLLLFVYCILYTCFGGSSAEEADKIGKNPYVCRFPDEHKGYMGEDVAGRVCHMAVMFIREPTSKRSMWHQGRRGPT
jgi:hypothetical protein